MKTVTILIILLGIFVWSIYALSLAKPGSPWSLKNWDKLSSRTKRVVWIISIFTVIIFYFLILQQ